MTETNEHCIYSIKYNLRDLSNISIPLPNFAYLIGSNEEEIRNKFDNSEREKLIEFYGDNYRVGYAGKIERIETPGFKLTPTNTDNNRLEERLDTSNPISANP
jgi:hypothetical protein|tara:strand:- start:2263 stop:2571 length:309 start_codon:yes stop_codon:yes gene_type:complete